MNWHFFRATIQQVLGLSSLKYVSFVGCAIFQAKHSLMHFNLAHSHNSNVTVFCPKCQCRWKKGTKLRQLDFYSAATGFEFWHDLLPSCPTCLHLHKYLCYLLSQCLFPQGRMFNNQSMNERLSWPWSRRCSYRNVWKLTQDVYYYYWCFKLFLASASWLNNYCKLWKATFRKSKQYKSTCCSGVSLKCDTRPNTPEPFKRHGSNNKCCIKLCLFSGT